MDISVNRGLNLHKDLKEGETAVSENISYSFDGLAQSREGVREIHSTTGSEHLSFAGGYLYSFKGTDCYKDGIKLSGETFDGINATETVGDRLFVACNENQQISGSTVIKWGLEAPTSPPVVAVGSAGTLTGTFDYKYIYVRKSATGTLLAKGNPSGSASVVLASQMGQVTVLAQSEATHAMVYRGISGSYF